MTINIVIFVSVSLFRLVFLRKSSQNEQDILAKGGMEYGVKNSNIMKYLHMLFLCGLLSGIAAEEASF